MKAVFIKEQGSVDVLTYGDLPEPVVCPTEIKVRVRACALNRLDVFIRTGLRGTKRELAHPHVLGADIAGDVVEAGELVKTVKKGDRVVLNPRLTCGQCRFCLSGNDEFCPSQGMLGNVVNGGYAEYVKAPGVNAVPIPDSLSYEGAASLPTVCIPSWVMLTRRGNLKPWETVLVLSASSGVGTAAIQIAKHAIGASVIATTSTPEKAANTKEIGADHVINYKEEDIAERVKTLTNGRGVDVVVDHVGADFWDKAFQSMAPGGRYGICGVTTGYKAQLHMGAMFTKQLTVFGVYMGRKEDLRQIVELAGKKIIRGIIHQVFPLKEAAEAHRVMESQSFFGKLILTP